jgi:hypothetical protein
MTMLKKALKIFVFLSVPLCLYASRAELPSPSRLYPAAGEGGIGYIDGKGKMVISPRFDRADYFHEGLAKVTYSWGFDVGRGDIAGINPEIFSEDGYIDETGKYINAPQIRNTLFD